MKNDTEVTGDLAIFVADTETKIERTAAHGRSDVAHRGVVRLIALLALCVLPLATPSIAQDGVVDCEQGGAGCVFVAPERTRQQVNSRR
jgi:hypothetical protein